jgi:hypothetical protein
MYNIQFILLKSQHILTILSGHYQVIQRLNKCSIGLQHALPLIWAHIYNEFLLDEQY